MGSAVRTVISPSDAVDAIADAYEGEVGGEIPVRLLLALGAQSALETARWQACWGFNLGNMRGTGTAGSQAIAGADEIIDGKRYIVPAGFAAYTSLSDGAHAFVRYLCVATRPPAPNRYQVAIDAATRGDLPGFVHGLKSAGYFTASEKLYTQAEISQAHWLEKLSEMHGWVETMT